MTKTGFEDLRPRMTFGEEQPVGRTQPPPLMKRGADMWRCGGFHAGTSLKIADDLRLSISAADDQGRRHIASTTAGYLWLLKDEVLLQFTRSDHRSANFVTRNQQPQYQILAERHSLLLPHRSRMHNSLPVFSSSMCDWFSSCTISRFNMWLCF